MADRNGKSNGETNRLDADNVPGTTDDQTNEKAAGEPGATENPAQLPTAGIADLETELERLRSERVMYLDRLARLQAEFDNYRKRTAREQQEFRDYALTEALKQFLPILDSLDRALKTENADAADFRAGIELIDRQFHDVLSKLGVEPIAATGSDFDPTLHQAVQMVDTAEAKNNQVIDELQRGYKLRNRLLRPAMVRVASNPDNK
ncbi:MAG TPA: nucleotide exchange factor GrpE [Clostridia bacterium]|nr:nucleotide exchange factor GrpE [Clostridia bacterium]